MSNYMSNILISFLAAVCFMQTAEGQTWRRSNIDDGLVAKDTYCLFSSIRLGQSIEWIEICRNTLLIPCDGNANYFHDSRQMAAVADFISLWYRAGGDPYCKNDDFTLWRLASYMPPHSYIHSTKERFDFMCRQINSLLDYEKSSQWDYNLGACLEMDLEAFTVRMLGKELNKLNPIFKAEVEAFEDYLSAAATVYDYLIVGKDGYQGSSSTMRWAAFNKDRYFIMRQALEGTLFYLSDGIVPPDSNPSEFTLEMVSHEYDCYIRELPDLEDDYSIEERTSVLEAERTAWNNWLEVRNEIEKALPENQREIYHQQAGIICQSTYQMLKDRNNKYIK